MTTNTSTIRFLAAACAVFVISGCASNTAPTHRWASTEAATAAQYQNDHAQCQAQANLSNEASEQTMDNPAFKSYQACMVSQGYVLTALK